jgi:hypothetical protein
LYYLQEQPKKTKLFLPIQLSTNINSGIKIMHHPLPDDGKNLTSLKLASSELLIAEKQKEGMILVC